MPEMIPFGRWHKIGICAALGSAAAWCVLWFGGDVFPQRVFELVKVPAVLAFVSGILVGIYCWIRIMADFAKKLSGK